MATEKSPVAAPIAAPTKPNAPADKSEKRLRGIRVPLALKIGAFAMLLVCMVGGGIFYVVQQRVSSALEHQVIERGRTLLKSLSAAAEEAVSGGDDLTLVSLARDTTTEEGVAYAVVVDRDGKIRVYGEDGKPDTARLQQDYQPDPNLKAPIPGQVTMSEFGWKNREVYDLTFVPEARPGQSAAILSLVRVGLFASLVRDEVDTMVKKILQIAAGGVLGGLLLAFLISTVLVRPLQRLAVGVAAIGRGDFDTRVPVTTRDEIGDLTVAFNEMARSLREKELLKDAFGRYQSPALLQQVLTTGALKLGGEKREATILFSDIRSFTTITESLGAEQIVEMLNEYFSEMTDVILREQGYINKFIGDAIMALWGVPVATPDGPVRAVRAAVTMLERLKILQDKWRKEGKPAFEIGVGVNTGSVVVGNIGSSQRMEYTVIGDAVNLASRLEGLNKEYGTRIIISEATYQACKELIRTRPLEPVKVKGKTEAVMIYEVKSMMDAPRKSDAARR